MPDLQPGNIERYLQSVLGEPVSVLNMVILGSDHKSADIKGYGYGIPLNDSILLGQPEFALRRKQIKPRPCEPNPAASDPLISGRQHQILRC